MNRLLPKRRFVSNRRESPELVKLPELIKLPELNKLPEPIKLCDSLADAPHKLRPERHRWQGPAPELQCFSAYGPGRLKAWALQ